LYSLCEHRSLPSDVLYYRKLIIVLCLLVHLFLSHRQVNSSLRNMARTTVNISCACRLFFALAVTVLVCPGAVAFTPASGLHSQTVALQQQQQQMTTALRPSAAADVTTLKRDIAQNLRVLTAQRCRPCEEYDATAAAESSVALKEITAKLYNAPARTAWRVTACAFN
jgi:hypothetical protein